MIARWRRCCVYYANFGAFFAVRRAALALPVAGRSARASARRASGRPTRPMDEHNHALSSISASTARLRGGSRASGWWRRVRAAGAAALDFGRRSAAVAGIGRTPRRARVSGGLATG